MNRTKVCGVDDSGCAIVNGRAKVAFLCDMEYHHIVDFSDVNSASNQHGHMTVT